jgi:hypothetical protein
MNRRALGVTLLCVTFFTMQLPITSSQAFFGFSACEKLKSRVIAEEKIGKALWKQFHASIVANAKVTDTRWNYTVESQLVTLFQSDLKVFVDMTSHSSCFNPGQNVYLRNQLSYAKAYISTLQSNIAAVNSGANTWAHSNFKGLYVSYYEVYQTLKSVK